MIRHLYQISPIPIASTRYSYTPQNMHFHSCTNINDLQKNSLQVLGSKFLYHLENLDFKHFLQNCWVLLKRGTENGTEKNISKYKDIDKFDHLNLLLLYNQKGLKETSIYLEEGGGGGYGFFPEFSDVSLVHQINQVKSRQRIH